MSRRLSTEPNQVFSTNSNLKEICRNLRNFIQILKTFGTSIENFLKKYLKFRQRSEKYQSNNFQNMQLWPYYTRINPHFITRVQPINLLDKLQLLCGYLSIFYWLRVALTLVISIHELSLSVGAPIKLGVLLLIYFGAPIQFDVAFWRF